MTRSRRWGVSTSACVVALALLAGACGSDDTLQADETPTSIRHRFPAAVVSTTTTDVTTAFGKPRATTTTTRKTSGSPSATTTTTAAGHQPPPRIAPAATAMPAPRTGLAGTAWQGFVVVAGGIDSAGNTSARTDAYDPAHGTWGRGPDLPVALHDAVLAVLGDDLYLIGGFSIEGDQSIAQATTYIAHPGDTAWRTGPTLTTARGGAGAATIGDTIVVFGGETTDGGQLDTVETLKQGADGWADGPVLHQKRAYASAVVSAGRVYAVGGRVGGLSTTLEKAESWKPGDDDWRGELNLGTKRASAASSGNCVAGGENADGVVGSVECVVDRRWSVKFQMSVPRHGLAAATVDGWLHLVGGGPRPGPTVNAAHEIFDLTT